MAALSRWRPTQRPGWLRLAHRPGWLGGARWPDWLGRARPDWLDRPSGRFAIPGLLLAAVLALGATAGGYVVPGTAPGSGGPRAAADGPDDGLTDPATAGPPGVPATELPGTALPGTGLPGTALPGTGLPGAAPSGGGPADGGAPGAQPSANASPGTGTGSGRPADALTGWALGLSAELDIPTVALEAYGYAELVTAQSTPACKLSWTTLAGIGKIESDHGRAHATLNPDGRALPPIIGAPLDGLDGRDRIPDTDAGRLDGDHTWDHAVGPMQFIPATWQQLAVDADRDGVADPNDIDDAALAAANDLCAAARDLSTPTGWWAAIGSYNAVHAYAQDVYRAANDYGQRSH